MNRIISITTLSMLVAQSLGATELLTLLQQEKPETVVESFVAASGAFSEEDGRRFIKQLKNEIKAQYGIEADLQQAADYALRFLIDSGNFSEEEIQLAGKFFARIIAPEDSHPCQKLKLSSNHKHKHKHKSKHKNKKPELVLPDNLALGFCLMLGGGLLMIIPTGVTQCIGTGLILGGLAEVVNGVKQGEKVYYAEPKPLPNIGNGP
jgi:polyhydroxyalkanoate synthesis regulator phasin